jgi:hypothetical protein
VALPASRRTPRHGRTWRRLGILIQLAGLRAAVNTRDQVKLRTIALSLYGHPDELTVPFSFETRCLCNYVQRYARSVKIETNGFNQIVVHDNPLNKSETMPRVVPEKTLSIPFPVDLSRYRQATSEEKQVYFIEILRFGLQKANIFQELPLHSLLRRVGEFEANGFQNRWIHQSKSIRGHGLVAELQCELTLEEFTLILEVRRKIGAPMRFAILSTKPDETCFHYQFKDIVVREENLVVANRKCTEDERVRFPLSRFSAPDGLT